MDMLPVADAAPTIAAFDYLALDAATAEDARAAVARYRQRQEAYVLDTGHDLVAMKARLEHGTFVRWVEGEMGITARTAQNLMQAATRLGAKSEIVSHLPPTTLYRLAAPSTPEPLREEIVGRLAAGEALSAKAIDARLWTARAEARQTDRDAKLTPEERKRQAKSKRDAAARRQREHEKWQQDEESRKARKGEATRKLAQLLASRLDDHAFRSVATLMKECDLWNLPGALADAYGPTAADV